MRHSASNVASFWTVTDTQEERKIRSTQTLDADQAECVVPQSSLHLRNGPTDEIGAASVKATTRKFANSVPTLPPNVSSEIEIQGVPTSLIVKSKRNQKSSNWKQLATSYQKKHERQPGAVNCLNIQARTTSDENLKTGYDAGLGNPSLSNSQRRMQPLKLNTRRPKTASTQTPLGIDNQKLGAAKAKTGNRTNNGPHIRSREKCRFNEKKLVQVGAEYNTLK